MTEIWFEELHVGWHLYSWEMSWNVVGDMRDKCTERFGYEGQSWHFIDAWGLKHTSTDRMPFGIVFEDGQDALLFKLVYEAQLSN